MKKQSFMAGAATLILANAVSKILGAAFKIPLTYILHEDGMAIFGVAFQSYIMLLTFIISGFPTAISKIVSEKLAQKNPRSAHNTVKIAAAMLCLTGFFGTVILYFGAEFFALAMKEEKAVFAIKCISPSLFFVAAGVAYKSFYQGSENMLPTAASQVIEAFVKLAAGYLLSAYMISGGEHIAAGGAIAGVSAGEITASVMLAIMYFRGRRGINLYYEKGERRSIAKSLMSVTLPMLAASVISNALSMAETTIIRTQLLKAGLGAEKARRLYGAYTGYAMTVFNLPVGILATLGVSILPVISGASALGHSERAARAALYAIRLTIYLSVPCAVIMYLLPNEILQILFHNTASATMLKSAAPCVILLCVTQITASIMQAAGKIYEPIVFMFIGSAVRVICTSVLTAKPEFNIYGTIIASNLAHLVTVIINTAAVGKFLHIRYDLPSVIIKPASAAAVMTLIILWLKAPLSSLPAAVQTVCICSAGGGAYLCMLWLTGAVKKKDILQFRS